MLNRIVLIGRLTRDPELRYTSGGVAVTSFTLAIDRPFENNGQRETDFINIVTWRGLAETCANHLKKGRLTAVEGRLQIRSYDNNEGKKTYVTEIVADNVRFLDGNGQNQQRPGYDEKSGFESQDPDPFKNDGKPINISDDDLPF